MRAVGFRIRGTGCAALLLLGAVVLASAKAGAEPCFGDEQGFTPSAEVMAAIDREVAAQPDRYMNGRDRFWTVRAKDGPIFAYLYGMVHVAHPVTTLLPEAVYRAYRAAPVLHLEVSFATMGEARIAAFNEKLVAISAWQGPGGLIEAMQRTAPGVLPAFLQRRAIPPQNVDRLSPGALDMQIEFGSLDVDCKVPYVRLVGLGIGIDSLLDQWAVQLGKRVNAVDDELRSLDILAGGDLALDDRLKLLAVTLRRALEGKTYKLGTVGFYREGRIDRLMAQERIYLVGDDARAPLDQILAELYDQRNAAFVERLVAGMDRTTLNFIAVGAGHLPGKTGLVNALRARGFVVEPCDPDRCPVAESSRP